MDDVLCLNEQYTSTMMLESFRNDETGHSEMWRCLLNADAKENLRSLNHEFEPLYVISSSWASHFDLDKMTEIFKRTDLHIVLENLHEQWQTPRAFSSTRRDEIEQWLHENQEPNQPFLILDDMSSGWSLAYSPLRYDGRVVLCEARKGFTVEKLNEARELLNLQFNKKKIS